IAVVVYMLMRGEEAMAEQRLLRALQNVLKSFEDAEKQAASERQNQVLQEANELKRLEYQRRHQPGALLLACRKEPKITESLNKQIAERDARIRSLIEEIDSLKSRLSSNN